MTIKSMTILTFVTCDRCNTETEIEDDGFALRQLRPNYADYVYTELERQGWTWVDPNNNPHSLRQLPGKDICPTCSEGPTKEDVIDYKAYHAGEGIHTP